MKKVAKKSPKKLATKKGLKKKPIAAPKKQAKKLSPLTVSIAGAAAILKPVRGGFRLDVSPASEDDPQGGCVTVFPYPTEPYVARGDFLVWCEPGTCAKECQVHETWDDKDGHHDEPRGAATEKKPFHFKIDETKKDRHFQCRCDEKKG